MDIVGGVKLTGGAEEKIVSGIDDHSRFVISARVVARATARPTCDALALGCAGSGARARSSRTTARCSPGGSDPGPGRCCSTGFAGRTAEGS